MSQKQSSICECAAWPGRVIVNLGFETAELLERKFETIRERNPWLRAARCKSCGQSWYVAVDTVDDNLLFRRLNPAEEAEIVDRSNWPADYDHFVNVWPPESRRIVEARHPSPWDASPFESH